MSEFWLMDQKGGLLGPVGIGVLQDIVASGRISGFTRASRDGQSFVPLSALPEVSHLLTPPSTAAQHQAEKQRAEMVSLELDRYREMAPHELFGVPKGAPFKAYRASFLEIAKRYHPGRLPRTVHPDLLRACMEMFQFLQEQMARIEAEHAKKESVQVAATSPLPRAAAPAPATRRSPSWQLNRLQGNRFQAVVPVPAADMRLFTAHHIVNFSSGGMFVETREALALGTRLEVLLRFEDPSREIRARGTIVFESVGQDNRTPGLGVRLDGLSDEDKGFIRELVQQARGSAEARPAPSSKGRER